MRKISLSEKKDIIKKLKILREKSIDFEKCREDLENWWASKEDSRNEYNFGGNFLFDRLPAVKVYFSNTCDYENQALHIELPKLFDNYDNILKQYIKARLGSLSYYQYRENEYDITRPHALIDAELLECYLIEYINNNIKE